MAHSSNRILDALDDVTRRRLLAELTEVELPLKKIVFDYDQPIEHVYFPTRGVVSILGAMDDGTPVEVATIGPEGFVGLPVFLGAESTPARALVQIPGRALRMDAKTFRELAREPDLAQVLNRFTQALFTLLAQGAVCNRMHTLTERCARWLLLTADRVGDEATFPLTQEFLAQMLGVRRASVSLAQGELQRRGLIEYSRGSITIRNRAGLEQESCECYRIITQEFERLLNSKPRRSPGTEREPDSKVAPLRRRRR
jgi:CRP-like cAMP-binding protein